MKNSTFTEKLKILLKVVAYIPILIVVGGMTFQLPYFSYHIPGIKKSRDLWEFNLYPAWYILCYNIPIGFYMVFISN